MRYDITKQTAPKMPRLGKGTECIKILLSQVSKSMHDPLVPMIFPILGAHVSGSEFQYPDLTWKELCGQMANLVAESGGNKGQLSHLVVAICHDFRLHDEVKYKKRVAYKQHLNVGFHPTFSRLGIVDASIALLSAYRKRWISSDLFSPRHS